MSRLFISLIAVLFASPVLADQFPFNHDVLCRQTAPGTDQSSIKIVYDKTQHLDFGRIGQIKIEMNTGMGDLANIADAIGTKSPYRRILRTEGAAGQVGNLLLQDEKDPFVISTIVGFSKMDLIDDKGQIEKSLGNFLTTIRISRIQERGYFEAAYTKVVSRETILMEISGGLDGFGHYYVRFDPKDCQTLN